MATNSKLKNQIANKEEAKQVSARSLDLKSLLSTPTLKKKFNEVLDKKAPQFMASLLNLYGGDPNLQAAEPLSIVSSALVAASLDLPVDKNLGYAWIVPFYDHKKGFKAAQFQLGYKGYIQLALRSGQYKAMNVIDVREGELKKWNRLTEELELDLEAAESDKVVGYCGYFKLVNGFEKTVYWTKDEIESHRIKFNKAKDKNSLNNVWRSDYDAMAKKTVLRNLLGKWGILSIDMQTGLSKDTDSEVEADNSGTVIDVDTNELIDSPEPVTAEKPSGSYQSEQPPLDDVKIPEDKDLPF
ncbi:MAG: recombinase RecT [Sporolactobacillus sp.]